MVVVYKGIIGFSGTFLSWIVNRRIKYFLFLK